LREIIATGAPLGVHVVAIGGQDMLGHKLPSFYSRRLLLPFPKEETRKMHLTSKMTSPPVLPGRVVDASTGRHAQICDADVSPADLVARCRRDGDPARYARGFASLPSRITVGELVPVDTAPSPTWIPLGVGGPDAGTVGIDFFGGDHVLLVSGPPGSGRTTAAAAIVHSLRRVGVGVLAVAPPSSPLPRLLPDDAGIRVVTGASIKDSDLREAAAAFGENRYAIVVDDINQMIIAVEQEGYMDMPSLLDESAQFTARGRTALVFTTDATPALNGNTSPQSRIVTGTVIGGGAFMLLTPADRHIAMAHSVSFEPDQFFTTPPGRGYLKTGRGPVLLQLATPG
jgi:S-DNA-T family DNA segregation ATPase FtsK/SpoIIIE